MDGLSAAASVIAVVDIAAKVAGLCSAYIKGVRGASDDIQRLEVQVTAIHTITSKLKSKEYNVDQKVLQQCAEDLDAIRRKLEPKKRHSLLEKARIRDLKWPLSKSYLEEKIKALEGYCLVFSTQLQLSMDDKVSKAELDRLGEKLAYVAEAPFSSYENFQRHRMCLENTRVDVLNQIMDWATAAEPSRQSIFWLRGLAGTGKSTISMTVASRLQGKSCLFGSYFFRRGFGEMASARHLIPTLVKLLIRAPSPYRTAVANSLEADPHLGRSSNLKDQFEKLLLEPWKKLPLDSSKNYIYALVIDALDECEEERDIRLLLRLLASLDSVKGPRIRIFVTSRPELPIRLGFEQMPEIFYRDLALQDIARSVVDKDIAIFIHHEFDRIKQDYTITDAWPEEDMIAFLVEKSTGLFIFAATACRFIGDSPLAIPQERLEEVIKSVGDNELMTEDLDEMYAMILRSSIKGRYTNKELDRICARFRNIVGRIILLSNPLPLKDLYDLVDHNELSFEDLKISLQQLHAVLDIPKDPQMSIQTLHLSFRDFLLDKNRCRDLKFFIQKEKIHQDLALSCIALLSSNLHRKVSATLLARAHSPNAATTYSPAVKYACLYWTDHFRSGEQESFAVYEALTFLQRHFLHWAEFMISEDKIAEAIHIMLNLETHLVRHSQQFEKDLRLLAYECHRFLSSFRDAVVEDPSHLYICAGLYCPTNSPIKLMLAEEDNLYANLYPQFRNEWGSCRHVLKAADVSNLGFSSDGALIFAVAPNETSAWVFEAVTGRPYTQVTGARDAYNVAFSPIHDIIATSPGQKVVQIWDVYTGDLRRELRTESPIRVMELSPYGPYLAAALKDSTFYIWDIISDFAPQRLRGHGSSVSGFCFAPNNEYLVTSSKDYTLRIWQTHDLKCHAILKGHSKIIDLVAISSDSAFIASASENDDTLRLWDSEGNQIWTSQIGYWVSQLEFSPSGRLILLSARTGRVIVLFDVGDGCQLAKLPGTCFAFPPSCVDSFSIAVGEADGNISLSKRLQEWSMVSLLKGHNKRLTHLSFSSQGHLISTSWDQTVRMWRSEDNWRHVGVSEMRLSDTQTRPKDVRVMAKQGLIAVSFQSSDRYQFEKDKHYERLGFYDLITGKFRGHITQVLDLVSPNEQFFSMNSKSTVEEHHGRLQQFNLALITLASEGRGLVFSSDSNMTASICPNNHIRLQNLVAPKVEYLTSNADEILFLAFAPNGGQIAVIGRSKNLTKIEIWSISSKTCLLTLDAGGPGKHAIGGYTFSPDSKFFALESRLLRIWNMETGALVTEIKYDAVTAPRPSRFYTDIKFSAKSDLIAAYSKSPVGTMLEEIQVWSLPTGQLVGVIDAPESLNQRMDFHPASNAFYVDGEEYIIDDWTAPKSPEILKPKDFSNLQIKAKRDWITEAGEPILWLPPEFRPEAYAVYHDLVVIATREGQVFVLNFGSEETTEKLQQYIRDHRTIAEERYLRTQNSMYARDSIHN